MMLFLFTMWPISWDSDELYYWIAKIPHMIVFILWMYTVKYIFKIPNWISWPKKSPILIFVKHTYNQVRIILLQPNS